jgi:peptidoglycan/xylan/chitin deacetylase (PgdA/CDA1 family)
MKIVKLTLLLMLFVSSLLSNTLAYDKKIQNNSAVVFMYHRFGESKYPSTNVKLEQFKYHLDYLKKHNYSVWPFSKIVKYIQEKKQLPLKTVAITIDDAYISTYTEAYPRLKKLNFPFTVFVNTNMIDNKSKNFVTWDQMREMQKNGGEFCNHSLTHDYFIVKKGEDESMWKKRIAKEIKQAQKRLDDELGKPKKGYPKLFSYPYGEYSKETAEYVKDLGYVGVSQTSGPIGMQSDLKALPRFAMAEAFASPKGFKVKIKTLAMPIESISAPDNIISEQNPPVLKIKLKKPLKDMSCYLSSGERAKLEWISPTEAKVYSKKPLKGPRDRYTCTAWASKNRYFWYSHLWIINE